MIEYKIEEPALDITPEMAVSAYNVLRQYCKQHEDCYEDCVLYDICSDALVLSPNKLARIGEPLNGRNAGASTPAQYEKEKSMSSKV